MRKLEKHTEIVDGKRRWRSDSELLRSYSEIEQYDFVACSQFKSRFFEVLEEMGFKRGPYDHVLSLGEKDGTDSNLLGRVEVLWSDRDQNIVVRNRFRSVQLVSLSQFCGVVRNLWEDKSIEDILVPFNK